MASRTTNGEARIDPDAKVRSSMQAVPLHYPFAQVCSKQYLPATSVGCKFSERFWQFPASSAKLWLSSKSLKLTESKGVEFGGDVEMKMKVATLSLHSAHLCTSLRENTTSISLFSAVGSCTSTSLTSTSPSHRSPRGHQTSSWNL